jgi:MFS family permease
MHLPYFLAGGLTLAAMILAGWGTPVRIASETSESAGRHPWHRESFAFATGAVQGFLEGGTFAFLTLYLLGRGLGESLAGLLLGALFAGVLVAQLPMCWLADRWGVSRSLLYCLLVLLGGMVAVPWASGTLLLIALFVLGACCGALYPLGLALLGERVPDLLLARANAYYLTANCLGSLAGPVVIGLAIEGFGLSALFGVGALAVLFALALAPWYRSATTAPALPVPERRAA